MTGFSRNQKIFAVFFVLYSVAFHQLLGRTMDAQEYHRIWMLATGYGVVTFLTALVLGAFDPIRKSRGVQSFQYHLITFIISNVIWLGWNLIGLAPAEEMSLTYILGIAGWGLGLLVHFGFSRTTVKGIPKKEMFD